MLKRTVPVPSRIARNGTASTKPHRVRGSWFCRGRPVLGRAAFCTEILLASTLSFSDDLQTNGRQIGQGGNHERANDETRQNRSGHSDNQYRIYFPFGPENSGAGHRTPRVRLRWYKAIRGGAHSADR